MFSSLPSASKIYVSSSKPRQKSAASAKKKRKKVQCSSTNRENIVDATLVSLIGDEEEVLSEKNEIYSKTGIPLWDIEDSSSEISVPSVKTNESTHEILPKIADINPISVPVTENSDEMCVDVTVEEIEDLDSCFSSQVLTNEDIEEDLSSTITLEKASNSDVINSVTFDETVQSEENVLVETNQIDQKLELESPLSEIEINKIVKKNDLKLEKSENESSDVNKYALDVNDALVSAADENIKNHHTEDIEENILPSVSNHVSGNHIIMCSEEISNLSCDTIVEEKDSSSSLEKEDTNPDASNLYLDVEKSNVCIVINNTSDCNNNGFVTENPIESNTSFNTKVDILNRTSSPENSELSCTESFLYESKGSCSGIETSDTSFVSHSNNTSSDSFSSDTAIRLKEASDLKGLEACRSYSDLVNVSSCASVLKRYSSLPESLHPVKESLKVEQMLSLKATQHLDKGTFTADFMCESCGKGSSIEKVLENNKLSEHVQCEPVLASKSVSAKLENVSSWNVLPPLAMVHARARSYVFGSMGPTGSLLGNDELNRFFPDSQVTVFVGTWNMNSHDPPKNIDDFLLPLDINTLPDIYAIGVQESMQSRFEWEVLLQTTLGPSHVLFTSSSLGVLHLSIFIRRDLIWFCSEPEETNVATRPGSMVKTKGAVAVCFMFFGSSLLFVNSHLTAHEQKFKERLSDYEKIISSLDLPKLIPLKANYRNKDVTSRFDCVFWCGDLNFRVMRDRPSVLSFVEQKVCKSRPSCSFLVKQDQLYKAMVEGTAFTGFKEGVIHFIPSYKFDVGTSKFNSTKLRVPSYTDRILYRSKEKSSISCLHYNAVPDILTSDHKPVFAVFKVNLKPGRDNVPLAAGMFKRDVYLEAIKRRAKFLEVRQGQSTICNIM